MTTVGIEVYRAHYNEPHESFLPQCRPSIINITFVSHHYHTHYPRRTRTFQQKSSLFSPTSTLRPDFLISSISVEMVTLFDITHPWPPGPPSVLFVLVLVPLLSVLPSEPFPRSHEGRDRPVDC